MNLIGNNALTDELRPDEVLGRKIYRLAESGKGELRDLERAALRLHRCGEYALNSRRLAREGERYRLAAARACLERRAELPKDYEENPLDDQEKLDAIRLRVFGSVPE
jgi:DNA-binding PadR family transcriptional regulator